MSQLYLDDNEFGDGGVAIVAPLLALALTQLERLVLTSNAIGDHGITSLCAGLGAVPSGHWLKNLDLAKNEITDKGLVALTAEVRAGRVRVAHIDVSGNPACADDDRTRWHPGTRLASRDQAGLQGWLLVTVRR